MNDEDETRATRKALLEEQWAFSLELLKKLQRLTAEVQLTSAECAYLHWCMGVAIGSATRDQ